MKRILSMLIIALLCFSMFSILAPQVRAEIDNTLVVYVGAHPDDIDIGMSGSLYKHDVGKHPILWIVVTDGGADKGEYEYETADSRNWISEDEQTNLDWKTPDGGTVKRSFYSADLSRKRCGGYISGATWIDDPASHDSSFGIEYDWRTRVSNFIDLNVEKRQLSYSDPDDPTKRLLYPDDALAANARAETAFSSQIATDVAYEIYQIVESNGYRKDLVYINAHVPEEVCNNYETTDEHEDHRVTGNAVRQSIDYLHTIYGFGQVSATWYTIYSPIQNKTGYSRVDEDISPYKAQKSNLCKACWETDFINSINWDFYWNDYPSDPGNYEYVIEVDYYPPSVKDWTFMVYMDADASNLAEPSRRDLEEMQKVGSNQHINIIVWLDSSSDITRVFNITGDGNVEIDFGYTENLNSGDPASLEDFIRKTVLKIPANRYALVLWDHGGGAIGGCCSDESVRPYDHLSLTELHEALDVISSLVHFDVILFNACLMGTVEVAYEIRDYADYMVASEEKMWSYGFPYDTILEDLSDNSDAWGGYDLAIDTVTRFVESGGIGQMGFGVYHLVWNCPSTISAIDLSQIPNVVSNVNSFSEALINLEDSHKDEIREAREACENYGDFEDYADIYEFADRIKQHVTDPSIEAVADNLMTSVQSAVISYWAWVNIFGVGHQNTHGLSIYHPSQWYASTYDSFHFATGAPFWPSFLKSVLYDTDFYILLPNNLYLPEYSTDQSVEIRARVTNLRSEAVTVWMGVSIRDPNGEVSKYDPEVTVNPQSAVFDAGEERHFNVTWNVGSDVPEGTYWIAINCWKDSTYTERYTDNFEWAPAFHVYRLEIVTPISSAPVAVGDPTDPIPFYVAVKGFPIFPTIATFTVNIGNKEATFEPVDSHMLSFGIRVLKVYPPTQVEEGKYDLEVTATSNGATDTDIELQSVEYTTAPSPEPIGKGLAWLRTRQRQDGTWYDGSWYGGYSTYVGVTSLAALAFLNAGYDETDTTVHDAIQFVLRNVKPSGAIYSSSYYHGTYETSLAIMALVATHNDTYRSTVENAKDWLVNSQWDEDCIWGSVSKSNWYYGGFGYGDHTRPDLSNTQFALLALDAAGLPKDDSAWTKVQVFLHRCQDVDFPITLTIDGDDYTVQPYRRIYEDGGFSYTPTTANSYGSMHAAGIWGLLLSDVPMSDPRTVVALEWLRDHYTWDENPRAGSSWLYYYYLVMAKALLMTGLSTIDGHDWYSELYDKLVDLKHEAADKWYWQGSGWAEAANIATAYSILALQTRTPPPSIQRLSYLTIILRSPATLTVHDPAGRVVGFDYATSTIVNQIPNSVYSGPLTEPQYLVIVNPTGGNYKTELMGRAEESCELSFTSYYGDEITYDRPYPEDVVPGEVDESDCIWGTVVFPPKIVRTSPPTPPAIDVASKEWIRQLKVGETMSDNFAVSETMGQEDLRHVILTASDLETQYGDTISAENIGFSKNDFTVSKGTTESVTLTISIPTTAVPGDYSGIISITTENDGDAAILIKMEVIGRPTALNYIGDVDGQYSDPVTLKALLVDTGTQEPIAGKTIEFDLCGIYNVQAATDNQGVAEASILLDQPATTCEVTARFLGDEDYLESSDTKPFSILKEDAIVDYTGDTVLPTTAKTIHLRATVFDTADGWLGDITKIQFTFRIYTLPLDLDNPIVETDPIPVSETDAVGVGVATTTIDNLQENCYIIIASLDAPENGYYEAPTSDAIPLTVYEPTGAFATGGGWIVDPTESHGNFGFNVKYLRSGRVQGHSVYVYRVGELNYIVRSNALRGLAIQDDHAFFEGKCVVQIYNTATGELIWSEGNYKFRIDAWNNSPSGGIDIYQIRVRDKIGVVFHEAGFDPLGELQGGNIVIHARTYKRKK